MREEVETEEDEEPIVKMEEVEAEEDEEPIVKKERIRGPATISKNVSIVSPLTRSPYAF